MGLLQNNSQTCVHLNVGNPFVLILQQSFCLSIRNSWFILCCLGRPMHPFKEF